MDHDSYSEVTSQGWFSRIGESIKGILFGLLLFIVAFPLLWWNEGRSVQRYETLQEGQGLVINISNEWVDPINQEKLVHLQGLAETDDILTDAEFGISANAIKLSRNVLMYQWKENVKTESREDVGGKKTTTKTYSYVKEWSHTALNSSQFKKSGYDNPPMLFNSKTLHATQVNLGAFRLNPSQIRRISGNTAISLHAIDFPKHMAGKAVQLIDNSFYLGDYPAEPSIGDVKISFTQVGNTDISLIAEQFNQSFQPFQSKAGGNIDLLETGVLSADAMFAAAHQENNFITWGIRIGGGVIMWLGLSLLFRPLSVVGSVLPFLGDILAVGTGLLSFLISLPCTLLTIAIAWIAHRPLLAGGLIAVAVISFVMLKFAPRRKMAAAQG